MLKRLARKPLVSSIFVRLCASLPLSLQVKVLSTLLRRDRSRILSLLSGCKKAVLGHQSLENSYILSKPLILGYLPASSSGWILEYLFQDIASFAGRANFLLVKNPADLCLNYFSSNSSVVFTLHPSFVGQVIGLGISPENIISFYTHSRLGMPISCLETIRALLPMNSTEAAALALSNVDSKKIRVFPAGYDSTLFSIGHDVEQDQRRFSNDVLFVCRYEQSSNKHYYLRKSYDLIIHLGKKLARKGYKVTVLGKAWENCPDDDFKDVVKIIELKHHDYPAVYLGSKLLVTPSMQEGGPVSWLEAMACGCLTLSTCSGFPAELRAGELGSYLMPVRASVHDWIAEITRILELPYPLHSVNMEERRRFLSPATFRELAKVLEDLAFDSELVEHSLRWPDPQK